jgi:hypothetical protein
MRANDGMDRHTLLNRGAHAYASGQLAEAEAFYLAILAARPRDAETLSNLGAVRSAAQCHEAAEATCRAALRIQPGYWPALANLGNALHRQQRHEEAVAAYHAALQVNPAHASSWTNLGVALNEMQRMPEALLAHDTAARLSPDDPQIRCNRAMGLLMAGDYARGFAEFEWRWATPGMAPHGMTAPPWLGDDPAGLTILLHHEGGFGDTIQFIRYAPLLAARGATVIARVQTSLLGLLARSFPGVIFIGTDGPLPAHDMHCPLLSLPHRFATTIDNVPASTPYLRACPRKSAYWNDRFGPDPRARTHARIGLAWAGAPLLGMAEFRAMDHRRSAPPDAFSPLGGLAGVRFTSLQYGAADGPSGIDLFNPMGGVADFDDTAAIIANLDMVIAVDTAVAHLAGALGVPVYVLSRYDACWRWLAGRTDSPWYPAMRLYRQARPGEWSALIDDVKHDLERTAHTIQLSPRHLEHRTLGLL